MSAEKVRLAFGKDPDLVTQCRAKSKRSGERCRNVAIAGKDLCRMHGGTAKVGPDNPAFKHGKYSKVLPQGMVKRYHLAMSDPDRLALEHEIALVDARLMQLIERCETGDNGERWRQLRDAMDDFQVAYHKQDAKGMSAQLRQMDALIRDGLADHANWQEIMACVSQRQRLVESERKRFVEMQQTITVEQAMTFVTAVMESVRRNVPDAHAQVRIAADMERLLGRPDARGGDALPPAGRAHALPPLPD